MKWKAILDAVTLSLDGSEALVLFELLSREIDDKKADLIRKTTQRDGEMWALNSLLCILEKELAEPLSLDYPHLVEKANNVVEQKYGKWP